MDWHLIDAVDSPDAIRPTACEIDLDGVRHNARLISRVAGTPLVAVVKAEAYGHGALPVARALTPLAEVRGFAVNLVEEAIQLRDAGIDGSVLVMGPSMAGGYDEIVARGLTPMVSSRADLEGLQRAAARRDRRQPVHLYIDTGMSRLGFALDDGDALAAQLAASAALEVTGLCTHFACADEDDPDDPACLTRRQLKRFAEASARYRSALVGAGGCARDAPLLVHHSNSAAALRFLGTDGDFARVGLALYGNGPGPAQAPGEPAGEPAIGSLRQVMRVITRVAQIRTVAAGESVSYGALYRAARTTAVAVLPLGYADGVPRRVTGRAQVLIRGRRCPTIGAITMGMILVDVTDMPQPVRVGEPAVLLGRQDDGHISTAEFAGWAGCIEYEVTCGIGRRVPRVYKGQA